MATRVFHSDKVIGTIHDLVYACPHWIGRWEPEDPEIDAWVRSGRELIVVRLEGHQNEHYISNFRGTMMELRMVYDKPPKWWEFWKWSGLCDI
jgi:hypothetical protein